MSAADEAERGEGKALSLDIEDVGKRIRASKKRITFKFCFLGGPEHVVVLIHSVVSGKKRIEVDGQLKFEGKEVTLGEFRFPFQLKKHLLSIVIDGPDYEYDLLVDGRPFRQLPRISFLDMRAARQAAKDSSTPSAKAKPVGRRTSRSSSGNVMDFNSFMDDSKPAASPAPAPAAAAAAASDGGDFNPFGISDSAPSNGGGGDVWGDAGGAGLWDAPAAAPAPAPAIAPPAAAPAPAPAPAPALAFNPFDAPPASAPAPAPAVASGFGDMATLNFDIVPSPTPAAAAAAAASAATGPQPTKSSHDLNRLVNMDNLLVATPAAAPAAVTNSTAGRRMSLAERHAAAVGTRAMAAPAGGAAAPASGGFDLFGAPVAPAPATTAAMPFGGSPQRPMRPSPSMVYVPSPVHLPAASTAPPAPVMGGPMFGAAAAAQQQQAAAMRMAQQQQQMQMQWGGQAQARGGMAVGQARPGGAPATGVDVDPFASFM